MTDHKFALMFKGLIGSLIGLWTSIGVITQTLLLLMSLDVLTGMAASYLAHSLSSRKTYRGVIRKSLMVGVVLAAHVVSRGLGKDYNLPVNFGAMVAAGFCLHELVSILENARRSGLPMPQPVQEVLKRLAPRRGDGERPAK